MAGRRISLHLPCCQKTDLAQVSFLLFVFRGLSKGLCLWDCGLCVIGNRYVFLSAYVCVGLFLFDRVPTFVDFLCICVFQVLSLRVFVCGVPSLVVCLNVKEHFFFSLFALFLSLHDLSLSLYSLSLWVIGSTAVSEILGMYSGFCLCD